MRIFIAEKPSAAQVIADALGGASTAYGYIECGSLATRVTWCFGHLPEEAPPEEYVPREGVRPEDLPVIPERWKLSPRDGAAGRQVNVIRELLKAATEVVNAGDADRKAIPPVSGLRGGICLRGRQAWQAVRGQAGGRGRGEAGGNLAEVPGVQEAHVPE